MLHTFVKQDMNAKVWERTLLALWLLIRNANIPAYVPRPLKQFARQLFLNRIVWVEIEEGVQLRSRRTDSYLLLKDEHHIIEDFKTCVRPGALVLDIGANVGFYTLLAAKGVSPTGRVIAIEPDPENLRLLEENIRHNHYENLVQVFPYAASNQRVTKQFFRGSRSTENSLYPFGEVESVITVECLPLNDVTKGQRVNLIKIDVEGHELEALDGLEETIQRSEQLVTFVECNPTALAHAGHSANALVTWLGIRGCAIEWAEVIFPHGSEIMGGQEFTQLLAGTREWYNSTLKCIRK